MTPTRKSRFDGQRLARHFAPPCFSCGGTVHQALAADGETSVWRCPSCGDVAFLFVWDDLGRYHGGFARPDEVPQLSQVPPPDDADDIPF